LVCISNFSQSKTTPKINEYFFFFLSKKYVRKSQIASNYDRKIEVAVDPRNEEICKFSSLNPK